MRNIRLILFCVVMSTSFAQHQHDQLNSNPYLNQQYLQPDGRTIEGLVFHPEESYNNPCAYSSDSQCAGRSSIAEKPGPNEECPQPYGFFRNGLDCGKFIRCAEYMPYFFECPAGTIYDTHNHRCDYPDKVRECNYGVTKNDGQRPYSRFSLRLARNAHNQM